MVNILKSALCLSLIGFLLFITGWLKVLLYLIPVFVVIYAIEQLFYKNK